MKNTKKLKQILVISTLLLGMLSIGGTNSQAALQANAATHSKGKTDSGASWITSIRQMEASGQTMGLNEKIKADLTTDGDSNNIDVHMMKSTEYGAMAILSASGFGNQKTLQNSTIKTTTGNVTGVYITGTRNEWTAGVCSASTVGKDARYYDLYTTAQTSARVGDALGCSSYANNPGCSGWHSGLSYWLKDSSCGFIRGYNGIFTFIANGSNGSEWAGGACYGRGVAVVGANL